MKTFVLLLLVVPLYLAVPVVAQQKKAEPYTKEKLNPRNDPDVQRGIDRDREQRRRQRDLDVMKREDQYSDPSSGSDTKGYPLPDYPGQ